MAGDDPMADMVDISVRPVGESAATSRDGNWDAAEATLTSAFATLPPPPGRSPGPGTAAENARRRMEQFAALCADGRYGDAVAVGAEIVEYHRRYFGGYHYRTVRWAGRLGEAHLRGGDPGRAVSLLGHALTALESLRGGDDPETRHCRRLYDAARGARRPSEEVP